MATLNNNWQMLAQTYLGSTGSLNVYVRAYAKLNSQNQSANTSNVSYENRLYAEGSGSYFWADSGTLKGIAATGISNSVESANGTYYKGETTLQSRSATITHSADGSGSGSISTSFASDPWGWSASAAASFSLPKINRYAKTNSVTGSSIDDNFSVNYTKYVSSYKYKLRISRPGIEALERIDYNTSDTTFQLSQETINRLYDVYGTDATFQLGFAVETWKSDGSSSLGNGNEVKINCTTSSKGRIRINGEWKNATLYVRTNGEWKKATPYIRNNNEWKRGK